ncbi:MAG: glycosyltransferase family 2 protein [Solobacterium sp.]|nr:glycosyltransferase family 2 protein [Solobacterium sp.]
MQDALISIITPVYNAESYIETAFSAVLQQTWQNWEWILVDDCSGDQSAEIIRRRIADHPGYAERIRLIALPENGGAANARNTGVKAADGRYIAFLDADDMWQPDKLAEQLRFMQEKNAAFSYHSYEFGKEDGTPTGRVVRAVEELTYDMALTRTIIFTSTVMFDMEKMSREEIMMPHCPSEDTALWWQLLRNGYTAYGLDKNLAVYRRPAKSLSSNKLVALERIWYLYREREHLSLIRSVFCFIGWAYRATARRL